MGARDRDLDQIGAAHSGKGKGKGKRWDRDPSSTRAKQSRNKPRERANAHADDPLHGALTPQARIGATITSRRGHAIEIVPGFAGGVLKMRIIERENETWSVAVSRGGLSAGSIWGEMLGEQRGMDLRHKSSRILRIMAYEQ